MKEPARDPLLLLDTHVHLRRCFRARDYFDAAWDGATGWARGAGEAAPWQPVLMLTESATEDGFRRLTAAAAEPDAGAAAWGGWRARATDDDCSLWIERDDRRVLLIAGRQIDTAEGLEVSVLGSDRSIPDRTPVERVLELAREHGGVAVLPWAPGKWWFRRGRLLHAMLDRRPADGFYLGDNGGRPWAWPRPAHLRRALREGVPVLPGSDPLPFEEELLRTGTFGARLRAALDPDRPGEAVKAILRRRPDELAPYGRRARLLPFLRKEWTMQWTKGRRKRMAPVGGGSS